MLFAGSTFAGATLAGRIALDLAAVFGPHVFAGAPFGGSVLAGRTTAIGIALPPTRYGFAGFTFSGGLFAGPPLAASYPAVDVDRFRPTSMTYDLLGAIRVADVDVLRMRL